MTYCKNCGVETDLNMNFCPLCGEPATGKDIGQKEHREIPGSEREELIISQYKELTQKQRRKLFWELSAIILVSGIIVSLIINLVLSKSLTWSRYPVIIGLVAFLNITFIAFWQKRIILLFTGSFISTSILLMVLEFFNRNMSWSLTLGIPVLLAAYLITLGLISTIRISRQRGLNLIAFTLVAIGLLTMCIEGIISLNTINRFFIQLSIIVLVCIIPVAGILLFIQYRLKKATDLRKFFHI
jgi:hypothetical protein